MNVDAGFADLDLRRLEEVGLNALQTQRQLFYDGWLLRLSPGKARRARSVNAHFGSTLPLPVKLRHCERVYRERQLPLLFRITPFVQPPGLSQFLAGQGYVAFDTTLVQVLRLERPPEVPQPTEFDVANPELGAFADAVATLQGATPEQRNAYLERMVASPQATRALLAEVDGQPIGVGTAMLEDGLAGLYSMATAPQMRARGVASAIVAKLLCWAWEHGATHAYLQAEEDNEPALAVYRRFGFVTAYTYHYCARPEEAAREGKRWTKA